MSAAMRAWWVIGLLLIILGLLILFLLRDILFRLILFALEFLGIAIGVFLVIAGAGILAGARWARRWRSEYVAT